MERASFGCLRLKRWPGRATTESSYNVLPHDAVVLLVAFAQDGVVFLGAACLGDEIDDCVLCTDAEVGRADLLGPVGEEPHVGIEVRIAGLVAEVGADEFLEVAALFLLRLGGDAVVGKDAFEGRGGHGAR